MYRRERIRISCMIRTETDVGNAIGVYVSPRKYVSREIMMMMMMNRGHNNGGEIRNKRDR